MAHLTRNTIAAVLLSLMALYGCNGRKEIVIMLEEGESVWGGRVKDGSMMPFCEGFYASLNDNRSNQVNPLLLTSKGRYIWSEHPYTFRIGDGCVVINDASAEVVSSVTQEGTLASAFSEAAARFFPADGKMPPSEFFEQPQYNTWIELMYDQNQQGIIEYAEGILANGLPAGIIMIDDTWQDDYGKWTFAPERFPDPKGMVDRLHEMGFKVMLWICPFVSMDQYQICSEITSFDGFVRASDGLPYPVRWWNGTSAVLDFSNPRSVLWLESQLHRLMEECGVDGFKFDAGDFDFYPEDGIYFSGASRGCEQCSLFVQIAEKYPYNELRAGWKNAGKAIVQRLHDKEHSWEDLRKLIPEMCAEGLMGFSFCCPDMVGGGSFGTFLNGDIDHELLVRSAQCHALMPMMQFSLAPWRVLEKDKYNAVLKAVRTRYEMLPLIRSLMERAASTGEPAVTPLEYHFPGRGYERVCDEFMLGKDVLVAPMLAPGDSRTVLLPEGTWVSDTGEEIIGGTSIKIFVPLDRLPYFMKKK
ncbi:MAG: glycoside hydrolase family 31 protein [Bacteroidales bacterium]|nr:glycoside hydrolase family 31 protein [Bacteroidales bacterium]